MNKGRETASIGPGICQIIIRPSHVSVKPGFLAQTFFTEHKTAPNRVDLTTHQLEWPRRLASGQVAKQA